MGTNLMRALLLTSASLAMVATATPTAAYAQEAAYQIDIPAQSMGDALRALGKATKQNIVFNGSLVKGKRSAAVRGRMSAGEALDRMLQGSGLKMSRGSGGGLLVQAGGNTGPAPTSSPRQSPAAQNQGRGTVVGTVKDETSGAALKGALVELVGTGRKTSTDDLGEFRFPNVVAGEATVRISYLGYVEQQSTLEVGSGETYQQDFTLKGGSGGQEIVVYGSRSARAQALNQERTAENVQTVLSSDVLGDFNGTTISESLRRAPGVVFRQDSSGDGSNIIIRGLEPDLNTVKFNGIELPETSGTGRSASLANILTESVSKVTISKTLLPNQDSSGTGGLVEIETRTPLDRPRRYLSVTVEGAKRGKGFNDEFLSAGTISGKFGSNEQFGVSASIQYRTRDLKSVAYASDFLYGQYLPLQVDGTPTVYSTSFLDPRTPFPFEPDADEVYPYRVNSVQNENSAENLGLTFSAAWEISDRAKLVATYQKLDVTTKNFSAQSSLNAFMGYPLLPVVSLGGEQRLALDWTSRSLSASGSYNYTKAKVRTNIYTLEGDASAGKFEFRYRGGYTEGSSNERSYSLGTSSNSIILADNQLLPEAVHPVEGRILSPFAQRMPGERGFPRLLLNESGFDALNASTNFPLSSASTRQNVGANQRFASEASARYVADGKFLKYLEIGASYENSKFTSDNPISYGYFPVGNRSLSDFGLIPAEGLLGDVGVESPLKFVPRKPMVDFLLNGIPSIAVDCQTPAVPTCPAGTTLRRSVNIRLDALADAYTREKEFAAYLQTAVNIGKLEVVGGVRFSKVDIEAVNLRVAELYDASLTPDVAFAVANSQLVSDKAKQTAFLPRILANYRVNDQIVLRGGYFLSVARPQINLLSSSPAMVLALGRFFGPNGNQFLFDVRKGNPDLKPSKTHNFDFSAEYYDKDIGVIKVGAFYKRVENLLESTVSSAPADLESVRNVLPDDPRFQAILDSPEDYFISIRSPINNAKPAHVWGIEASLEKQLTFLPGWLGGFGVYANYTFTDSARSRPKIWSFSPVTDASGAVVGYEQLNFEIPNIRFKDQARHSGTLGLTYNKFGIDANIAYTYQARRQADFLEFNLNRFEEGIGTLDVRAEYRFGGKLSNLRLFFEGSDLLRSASSPATNTSYGGQGITPNYYYLGAYNGGRQLRIGATVNF